MSPITSLRLLVADLGPRGTLCARCQFAVRQSHVRAYPKYLAGFLVIILHSSTTNSSTVAITERTR